MKAIKFLLIMSVLLITGNGFGNDSSCKIEGDVVVFENFGLTHMQGETTCKSGVITVRMYDGNDKFVGREETLISGYSFEILTQRKIPKNFRIKYSIETY